MQRGLSLLLFRSRKEHGFTLVEVMVSLCIISVLILVSLGLFTSQLGLNTQMRQLGEQQQTIESAGGWMQARVLSALRPFGLLSLSDTTKTDPLTIAGDQLVFKSNTRCYRVFYVERVKEIRAAVADNCSTLRPKRGPNEKNADGSWVIVSDQAASKYDPALDAPAPAPGAVTAPAWFTLAEGIVPNPPTYAPAGAPSPLQAFAFRGDDSVLIDVDARANSSASAVHAPFYTLAANRENISSVDLTAYVAGAVENAVVKDRYFRRNLSTAPTQAAYGPPVSARVDGAESNNWRTISAGENAEILLQNSGAQKLATTEVASQDAWLEFDGAITLRSGPVTLVSGGIPNVKAILYRNGTATFTASSELRTAFIFKVPKLTSSTSGRTIPFNGSFRLPTGTNDSATTTYSVRLYVENTDTNSLQYTTDRAGMYLRYRLVPR